MDEPSGPTGPIEPTEPGTTPDGDAEHGRVTDAATEAAVARVRDADPAAGATPDLTALHARLAGTTGVALGAAAAGPRDEMAAARARRGAAPRWLQVAAVAAGVALVGGGGYAVGAAGADEPAAPPIALQGAQDGAGLGVGGAVTGMAEADARMIGPGWFGGRTVFSGSGLDGAAGQASAWAFDASTATAQTAARVAEVLGVPGEPRQEWGQWVVGSNDGMSATVNLGVDGQASVWFFDPAWDPSVCQVGEPETLDDGTSASSSAAAEPGVEQEAAEPGAGQEADPEADPEVGTMPVPEPGVPQAPAPADPSVCDPGSTPTGDAAAARARDLIASLGVDVDRYEVTVGDDTGVPGLVSVTGAQVVDGMQTGVTWSVQLAGTGVQSLSASLATLVELGTYDVVSADEAVRRLNDPRFGASSGGVVPLAARADAGATVMQEPAVEPSDEATVPPVPAPGDPVAWPVQQVTVTSARLGVTLLATPAGASLVVPAWELTDEDGGTWSVVAVVEDQLDLGPA